MRDQTARDPKFPAACARCGGRISEPVTFCPHCGAHARFALAGDASHAGEAEHASQAGHASRARREPRGAAASARPAPTVPPYDFEGDLDPPWPGPPTPLFASPDGDPYGEVHAPGMRGERQWGLKWGTALVVGAFVVLYGGVVAVHRYDGVLPLSQSSSSKSAEGAIASNGGGSNFAAPSSGNTTSNSNSNGNSNGSSNNAPPPPAPVAENTAPSADANGQRAQPMGSPSQSVPSNTSPSNATASNGPTSYGSAANDAVSNSAPPAPPKRDESRSSDTSVAQVPPAAATVQAPPPAAAPTQALPQTSPSSAQTPRATARTRSPAQSAEARSSINAAVVANAAERQSRRLQSQPREPAQFGRAAAARALENAQVQLAKSDLRGARGSLARALAADPNNADARSLRDQLLAREQERDASLSAAHACVVQSRWNCVWHNAGKALAVDASSTEAKALVDRAIVESGAATTPAGPGPDNVQVPMIQ